MNNPSSTKKYKPPIGRLAKVQSIQNYSRTIRLRPQDYISSDVKRNPKNIKKNEYELPGGNEFPAIHRDTPGLQQGKPKKVFKDSQLFEMNSKKQPPQKNSKNQKKKKQVHLDYRSEFHSL
jgi:hypothetical protein